jgi:transmembrane sensor
VIELGKNSSTPPPNAMEVEARAADWVTEQHNAKTWTEDGQMRLDAWLAQSLAHRVAYVRLNAAWRRTHRLAALRSHDVDVGILNSLHRRIRSGLMGTGVALVVIGLLAGGVFALSAQRGQAYATGLGEHRVITLADGSKIELNTNTSLRVLTRSGERRILLGKGEAFFQIRHDAARKFIVIAAGHRIVDLGTQFTVRNDSERVQVMLLQGRARIESVDARRQTQSAVLSPGDLAVATARSLSVLKETKQALADETAWRQGELVFHFTSLANAAAEFNRYNRKKIVVADSIVARRQIGGTFATNDVALFGRIARDLLGVQVEDRGAEIVISR